MDLNQVKWTDKSQKAFEKYMKDGGGFVVIHEADNAFSE